MSNINVFSMNEVAQRLGVPVHRVYYDEMKGHLRTVTVAGRKVVTEDEVSRYRRNKSIGITMQTPGQYCRKNSMSRSKFDYWRRTGKIRVVKIGGRVYVDKAVSK